MCPLLVRALSASTLTGLSSSSLQTKVLASSFCFHNPVPMTFVLPTAEGILLQSVFPIPESIRCISSVKDSWQEPQMGKSGVQVLCTDGVGPWRPCTTQDHGRAMILANSAVAVKLTVAWHTGVQKTTPRTHHS